MGTNIMFWNYQGIRPEHKELELYLTENSFDIVELTKHSLQGKRFQNSKL